MKRLHVTTLVLCRVVISRIRAPLYVRKKESHSYSRKVRPYSRIGAWGTSLWIEIAVAKNKYSEQTLAVIYLLISRRLTRLRLHEHYLVVTKISATILRGGLP